MAAQLRVYPTDDYDLLDRPEATVRVSLGDLLPLVALAQRKHYLWLQDFLDDEVQITEDLYEVLRAFRASRSPA